MIKLPPALSSTAATDHAVRDLLGAAVPLGQFILSMPDSPEKDLAAQSLHAAMLYAHQGLLRGAKSASLVLAGADELPH